VQTIAARRGTEPEVLVPRAEIEMYRRLIAAAQQTSPHAEIVDAPADTSASRTTSDITIDPIQIKPIVPPVSGEGDRQ